MQRSKARCMGGGSGLSCVAEKCYTSVTHAKGADAFRNGQKPRKCSKLLLKTFDGDLMQAMHAEVHVL